MKRKEMKGNVHARFLMKTFLRQRKEEGMSLKQEEIIRFGAENKVSFILQKFKCHSREEK